MPKLSPDQKTKLEELIREGKTNTEIAEYFKSCNVDISPCQISYKRAKISKPKGKRRGHIAKTGDPMENILKEILSLVGDIHSGYQKMFKFLRLELIKSRGQVYEMLNGAGIPVDEE